MKKYILFPLILSLLSGGTICRAMDLTSSAAIAMDTDTGRVYYEYNADTPLAPASITKIMTVYLMYEEMEAGRLSKDTLITADAADAAASRDPEATNVILDEGVSYTVDELLGAIIVPSACASAAMVGKYISGSEAAFAQRMTQRASKLGLNAYFEDSSGLSNANRISARSVAELVRLLVNKYPDVLNYSKLPFISFHGRTYNSTNHMLPGDSLDYPGITGFKTGTTKLAGACFAGTAERNGLRVNSVTMHSEYGKYRFSDTKQLLDFGFAEAENRRNYLYPSDIRICINGFDIPSFEYTGNAETVPVLLAEDLIHYGFSLRWDNENRVLTISPEADSVIYPIDTAPYKAYLRNAPLLRITNSGGRVNIKKDNSIYSLQTNYDLNGYLGISANELAAYSSSYFWDNSAKCLYIDF